MDEQSTLANFEAGESSQIDQYECGICGRSFDSVSGRGTHMTMMHDESEIKTRLIIDLQNLADTLGRPPTQQDMKQEGVYGASIYKNKFDSWNEALSEANIEVSKHHDISKSSLLDELTRLATELGQTPGYDHMAQKGNHSASVYEEKFGSWNEALREADLEVNMKNNAERKINESTLQDELARLANELGQTPTQQDMKEKGAYGVDAYKDRFDSWNDALREAGLDLNVEQDIPDSELLTELIRLADELEQPPLREDMRQQGDYGGSVYERRFGSWNEALKQAELEIQREADKQYVVIQESGTKLPADKHIWWDNREEDLRELF